MKGTLTSYGAPRDVLRAAVAASREIADAERTVEACVRTLDAARAALDLTIERRGETLDAIALMMEEAGTEVVTFYDGPRYWAAVRSGELVTLLPASSPTALSLDALTPRCEAPAKYLDGAHASAGGDDRLAPFPPVQRFNPSMTPIGDADALFASFMDRLQSGGVAVPDDLPHPDDDREAARFAAFHDLFAPVADAHVRPSDAELARGFAVPDDLESDEGLDEALDDLDDEDFEAVPEPDDSERTAEYPPVVVPAETAAEDAA